MAYFNPTQYFNNYTSPYRSLTTSGGTLVRQKPDEDPNNNGQTYTPPQPPSPNVPRPPKPMLPPEILPPPPNPFNPNGGGIPFNDIPTGDPISVPSPMSPEDKQRGISDKLLEQLLSFIGDPSRYNQDVVAKTYEAQRGRLQQGFDVERQRTMEDASRRGLFYSTEPTGRLGDIGGQQARAESDLMANIQQDQAKTYSEDMSRAINTILGFGNQQFNQQLATAQMNMLQDEQLRNFLLQLLGSVS